ncbi:diguanylate cyclase [Actinoplanes sp. NPDC051470]|uniref:tetratricopeptide repeat-containing diguanylate cyclase n=1 Tax=Actinoplanes sp. NPDC051470 TaxID=3157224 RepID=UPI00342E7389
MAPALSASPCEPRHPEATPIRRADELATQLDDLEDPLAFDVLVVLAKAAEIERAAKALGDSELRLRARLLQADMWQREGQATAVASVLWEVNAWTAKHDHRALRARSDRLSARIFYALGDMAACLEHAVSAVQHLEDSAPARTRSAYLMALGGALNATGSFEQARKRYQQAERFAVASGDVQRQLAVLNNLAYSELEAGDAERAWEVVQGLQTVAAEHQSELNPNYLDTVAQVQIAIGRYAEAEQAARASIHACSGSWEQEVDSLAQFMATLAVAQRHLGATAAAQDTLDRCRLLCDERNLTKISVQLLQEQAELYGACGEFERAFLTHKAFYAADIELISQQREAQARTRQAMFETAEAREDAARFREQARHDPLTGLPNRRHLDEHLPAMIDNAERVGVALVAAVIDVDHFKRVNDTFSHQIGDQALVVIAGLLAAAVPASTAEFPGFAARTGGEEFLLILPGIGPKAAAPHLEALRHDIAAYPWQKLANDLTVTVSIGMTATRGDIVPSALLARADELVYAAKHAGRDRVCVDPELEMG